MQPRRLPRITSEEVHNVGMELKYKLMLKRIPLDQIDRVNIKYIYIYINK